MGRQSALIVLPLLFCVFLTAAAQSPTKLEPGTPIERTLGQGQTHEFTVELEENTLVQLVVEQKGADVIVRVVSPANKGLGEFDSPNGTDGPEHVSFVGITPGTYRISVAQLDPNNGRPGRYEIKILEMRKATDQEIKAAGNQEQAKAKGLALLTDVADGLGEIRTPQTRVWLLMQMSQLLWESDEKRASKYISDAVTSMKDYIGSLDVTAFDYAQQYGKVSSLRYELVQIVAAHNPEAALDLVYSTAQLRNPFGYSYDSAQQNANLELWIAELIAEKDPTRALEIARRTLKTRYSTTMVSTIQQVQRKNPELAIQFANEVADKLTNEKSLLSNSEAAGLAVTMLTTFRMQTETQRQSGLGDPTPSPLLGESQYRSLLRKALDEALSYSQPPRGAYSQEREAARILTSGLQGLRSQLETLTSGSGAAIDKKAADFTAADNSGWFLTKYGKLLSSSPTDAAIGEFEKAPAEQQDQLFLQLANREAGTGDLALAKQIITEHVKNPYQRTVAMTNIEQQEISRAVSTGKAEEALRSISAFRTPKERAVQLSQIVSQIVRGRKRATAISLLEQARSMLAPSLQAQDQEQMRALLEIARAFGAYDAKRAFEIVDPLIDQFNDLCVAARTMDGFGPDYYEDEELSWNGSTISALGQEMSGVIATLALADFERARAAADRLRLPEARFRFYLAIAQQATLGR